MRTVPAVFTRASRSSGSGVAAGTAVGDSAGGADVAAPPAEQAPATSTALPRGAGGGGGGKHGSGGGGVRPARPPTPPVGPVTYEAAGESRKATTRPISAGS